MLELFLYLHCSCWAPQGSFVNMASFPARNTNMNGIQIVTNRKKKLLSYFSMKNWRLYKVGGVVEPVFPNW